MVCLHRNMQCWFVGTFASGLEESSKCSGGLLLCPPSLLQDAALLQIELQPESCVIFPTDCLTPAMVTRIFHREYISSGV